MKYELKIHSLNVKGKYYVDQETCIDHELCCAEAPNHLKMDEENWCAYVFQQPEVPKEEKDCKNAMDFCPVEAIHDDGIWFSLI